MITIYSYLLSSSIYHDFIKSYYIPLPKNIFISYFICTYVLPECDMCPICIPASCSGEKRTSDHDAMGIDLVRYQVCARNQTQAPMW